MYHSGFRMGNPSKSTLECTVSERGTTGAQGSKNFYLWKENPSEKQSEEEGNF